jgi:hypothetical protein
MRKFILIGIVVALLALPVTMVHAAPSPDGPTGLERAIAVQQAHNPRFMVTPGVVGTAVGLTDNGRPAIQIFTETANVRGLPASLDGIPVVVKVTGKLFAMKRPDKPSTPGENNRNKPPQVEITSPNDGDTFSSVDGVAQIIFTGTASDKEDKKTLGPEDIVWKADGTYLGTGGSIVATLIDGDYTITAEVTDSGGKTAIDSILIHVSSGTPPPPEEDLPPEVVITSPSDGAVFYTVDIIHFEGTVTDDKDENLADALAWNSSFDGNLGTGSSTDVSLSAGTHSVMASVTDSGGNTGSASITIIVLEPSTYSTTDIWPRAVPIGISTGNANDNSAGTIACRVRKGDDVYALSNTHVFAPYAIDTQEALEDIVMQPGIFDAPGQVYNEGLYLGTLKAYAPIDGDIFAINYIDAAIALTDTETLGNATPETMVGYGIPNSITVTGEPGMAVQKFGRTTQLTKGKITGISGLIWVQYAPGWFVWFDDQLVIESETAFIQRGDSGSLLVTDDYDSNCYPVGLMFAGNDAGTYALANRIQLVLSEFGVSIDGK